MEVNKIYLGNVLDVLKSFPDESINCVITSPPYWSLRDYGIEPVIWDGDKDCEHKWGKEKIIERQSNRDVSGGFSGRDKGTRGEQPHSSAVGLDINTGAFCSKCGAWKGSLGLEPTFNLFIKHLMSIFDEIKRVLRKDGCCFVNLGDTYLNSGAGHKDTGKAVYKSENFRKTPTKTKLPDKSLCNIPARFSIAMQEHGWILRNEIIWYKRNCMPSSVKDRFTVDFEKIFFFTKNKHYWFEQQKVKSKADIYDYTKDKRVGEQNNQPNEDGRAMRCVWDITTRGFNEAHFAVFPEELVLPMIKSGCPEYVCKKCGTPREKIYEKKEYLGEEKSVSGKFKDSNVNSAGAREHYMSEQRKYPLNQKEIALFIKSKIKGNETKLDKLFGNTTWTHWIRTDNTGASIPSPEQYKILKEALNLSSDYDNEMLTTVKVLVDDKGNKKEFSRLSDCGCNAGFEAGIVLDPFAGSGTTLLVAKKEKRNYIGIDINPEYVKMAEDSIKSDRETSIMQTLKNIREGKQAILKEE